MLMQVIHLRGPAVRDRRHRRDQLSQGAARRRRCGRSASSRFALYHHVVRRGVDAGHGGDFADDFSRALDDAWRARLGAKKLYVNELFLTLVRRPAAGPGRRGGRRAARLDRRPGSDAKAPPRCQTSCASWTPRAKRCWRRSAPYGARLLGGLRDAQGPLLRAAGIPVVALQRRDAARCCCRSADLGEYLPYRRVSFGAETVELSRRRRTATRSFAAHGLDQGLSAADRAGHARRPAAPAVRNGRSARASPSSTARRASSRMNLALRRMRSAEDEALSLRQGLSQAKDDVAAGRAAFGEHHLTRRGPAPTPRAVERGGGRGAGRASPRWASSPCARRSRWSRPSGRSSPAISSISPGARLISTANFAGFASATISRSARPTATTGARRSRVLETTVGRPLLFQFPQGRPRQLHRHRPVGLGQDGGAELPAGPGAQVRSAHRLLRQGSRRGDVPARHRRPLRRAAARRADRASIRCSWPTRPANRALPGRLDRAPGHAAGRDLGAEDLARIKEAVDANYDQPPAYRRLRYFAELFRGDRAARRRRPGRAAAALVGRGRARLAVRQRRGRAGPRRPHASAST